eukprot:CAMPEP_0113462776 /NCGR_PEP_ID=MMETSP0014_2-20120614/12286_1 /TAXON_ID=2857 /ORGANISM="Nitzschia sp." /LENGTH=260 /DNA_ID=CAMNT_0000354689 /DNA_START=8 /DNA_END=788 /DNA_ORIENTATION=+ /assembly_acc=CAM_ASM_000159
MRDEDSSTTSTATTTTTAEEEALPALPTTNATTTKTTTSMLMQSTPAALVPSSQSFKLQQHRDLHLLPSTLFTSLPSSSSYLSSSDSNSNSNSNMTSAMKIPTTISPSVQSEIRLIHTPSSASSSVSVSTTKKQNSNSDNNSTNADGGIDELGERLLGDVLVATGVTAGVAPFLTVVDKAIVESSAGTKTLVRSGVDSIRSMVQNPVSYVKSPTFLLMWSVYAATYATANSFKTLEEHVKYNHERRHQQEQEQKKKNRTS